MVAYYIADCEPLEIWSKRFKEATRKLDENGRFRGKDTDCMCNNEVEWYIIGVMVSNHCNTKDTNNVTAFFRIEGCSAELVGKVSRYLGLQITEVKEVGSRSSPSPFMSMLTGAI